MEQIPWGPLGYVTYKRTYARPLDKERTKTEEFPDSINRVLDACETQLNCGFTKEERKEAFSLFLDLKMSVAGRFLWQLGTRTVDDLGLLSLQNCFSGQTRAVTSRGIASLQDLEGMTVQFLYNADWVTGTVKKFGYQPLQKVVLKKPGTSKHRLEIEVTPNHRWELKSGEITEALKVGDRIPCSKGGVASDQWFDEETKAGFLHGLIFGDGSLSYTYSDGSFSFCARLCGEKQVHKDLFDKVCYQPNCDGDPVGYYKTTVSCKQLPRSGSANYIQAFIEGWLAADGWKAGKTSAVLDSQHPGAYEWLVDHAAYAGLTVTGISYYYGATNFGPRSAPLARINLTASDFCWEVEEIHPLEEDWVYCAVVPGVERFTLAGGILTCNCAGVLVNHPIRPFTWTFDSLMLGSGVGFNIQREYVYEIPELQDKPVLITRTKDKGADFIVPDSREGWVELLERTLTSAFYTGKSFTYNTCCIRAYGEPIQGFGGTASGPEPLIKGISQITDLLNKRVGKKVRPIDCLDMMNIIGEIVVAGNVRRTAQIALGDCDDFQYLDAKRWDTGTIPNWRCMSNNSVVCNDINLLPEKFWQGYQGNGEPYGLINLKLAREIGRTGDYSHPDPSVVCFNPCSEQSLANFETCCLAEFFLPNITSYQELERVLFFLYRICKHSLTLPCHHKETEAIVHDNMRMGIGVTGQAQASQEQLSWLSKGYEYLRSLDSDYSWEKGWPESIKLSTVKPSGCSRRDSLIITDKGLLRLDEIGDTSPNTEQWQTVEMLNSSEGPITKFYKNGKVKTRILKTLDGFEYESSLNHRYWVDGDWKYVENLEIGDCLTAKIGGYSKLEEPILNKVPSTFITNTNQISQPEKMNPDLAFFLGLYLADGSTHHKGIRISFNRRDNDLIVLLKDLVKSQWGLSSNIDDDHGFCINSQQLLRWLKVNGCLKNYSSNLTIPKIIRESSVESVKAFIAGFWRGDGGQHNSTNWSICSVSEGFTREFAVLMRAVGYNVSIKNAGPGGYGNLDRWLIMSKDTKPNRYQSKELRSRYLADGGWLDPIVEIIESECETYDIEVENTHRYVLNGVISHNTLSLLPGVTPGAHPGYSQYHIRRIRMAAGCTLEKAAREHGYPVEFVRGFDGTEDHRTVVVEFPCSFPEGTIFAHQVDAIAQLENVAWLQEHWSDNAVSCTIYYHIEELPAIKQWLKENYNTKIKSCSFLLHRDHGFDQAPLEEITKEEYDRRVSTSTPITSIEVGEEEVEIEECEGGHCPVK